MKKMWFMEATDLGAKVVVFSYEVMREYLTAGYEITSEYQINLIGGSDYLPDFVGDE